MLALITGSGFYALTGIEDPKTNEVTTPFGTATLTRGRWKGGPEILFVPRHGSEHSVGPHSINYRANVWALHEAGASGVLATAVSGGIARRLQPGTFVLIDDFIDFTSGRADTFFDGDDSAVQYTDMSTPYDPALGALIVEAADVVRVPLVQGGTYCATNGTRFESKAEIRMMRSLGGDLVGGTGCPEVALARELELPYASIGIIANRAAGLDDGELRRADMMDTIASAAFPLELLIGEVIGRYQL